MQSDVFDYQVSALHGGLLARACFSIYGITVSITSDVEDALQYVDDTYAAFRCMLPRSAIALELELRGLGDRAGYLLSDSRGYSRCWPSVGEALDDLLDHCVHAVLDQLYAQGIYAIHASAAVYDGRTLILAGRSGRGKTTLALGLLRHHFGLLSDELAIVEPATQRILPYPRSLHIRPGTPELIPELRGLERQPGQRPGGGFEWTLRPDALERLRPGCLAEAAPLGYVLLLDGIPAENGYPTITRVPAAVAALELLRGTWAAAVDFDSGLRRMVSLLDGIACARLRVGDFQRTLDAVVSWIEGQDG